MYFRFKSLSEYFRPFPDISIQSQSQRWALESLKGAYDHDPGLERKRPFTQVHVANLTEYRRLSLEPDQVVESRWVERKECFCTKPPACQGRARAMCWRGELFL